jgi:voltage-gated potassium channel
MGLLFKRLRWVAALVLGVLLFGTVGFVVIAGFPLFDAFYMALTTIATVGYAEIHPLGTAGRVFNSILILVGVTAMFTAVGAITAAVVEMQLGEVVEKRRVRKMIEQLRGHYIVCGFGRVGRGAAAELKAAGAQVLIIDQHVEAADLALREGYLAVVADATRDEMLREAGIERARGLIAALGTDADNLFTVISAKTLNPQVRVVARAMEEAAESKLRRVGADAVLAPYAITGVRLAQALVRPHVLQFLDFASSEPGQDFRIEQIAVAAGSWLVSKTLAESRLRSEFQVVVLGIRHAGEAMQFNPPAEAAVGAGDSLIVMGEPEPLRRLEQLAAGGGA